MDVNEIDGSDDNLMRPLVISIMGHVDHGKTTLLDALRKKSDHPERPVAGSEAGGITQTMSAFQLPVKQNDINENDQLITVLDTPGHAAFSEMRRVCQSASDLVVLCIDINQGVADQTVEILKYLKESNCQFIVALTKCDKVGTKRERDNLADIVTTQLSTHDIVTESYGGEIQVVPVSSISGEGLDLLLSSAQDFYEPQPKSSTATVLNSVSTDRGRVLSIVAHQEIKPGSYFVLETPDSNLKKYGKIRALLRSGNGERETLEHADPSCPVLVLTDVVNAQAGDLLRVVGDENTAREIVERSQELDIFDEYTNEGEISYNNKVDDVNVISIPLLLKSPTSASLSALRAVIESLQHSNANLIQFNIIHSEVGTSMTQKEQIVLKESGGMFIGFDINVPKRISKNFGYQVS
eukprot:CAMPEP_0116058188 /NCGR_PEP_ID=MMETSP0322-20121206/5054_1 /TAXON_ID=163516 /ORGANISM="Leptocylindrus danicus var. apora, Strain B651" /LENGTH=409 /DNA_ID=CAMNT_0003542335 /DNA_START=315 /DNA_END=1544 /DNA_ORIENTATION=+